MRSITTLNQEQFDALAEAEGDEATAGLSAVATIDLASMPSNTVLPGDDDEVFGDEITEEDLEGLDL
jgi:hypothetical protein